VIFFYPAMMASLIAGGWQLLEGNGVESEEAGLVFFTVLALNLLVISFEFSRLKTVAIILGCLAVVFLLLFLGTKYAVLEFLRDMIRGLHLRASSSLYFSLGGYLLVVFAGIFINTRWNFFEVRHNEIVHHTGFLGDIRRFPSPNLKFTKEINDVFEFLLLGSGRIILYPTSEKEAIVLDNVLNVNRVESQMKQMLSAIAVEVNTEHEHGEPEG
jgi:hypothetical protein